MRRQLNVALSLAVYTASALSWTTSARADECPSSLQLASCHTIQPSEAIAGDVVEVPLDQYTPYVWREGRRQVAPPSNVTVASMPGLNIELGAGGWGENAKEPMAIARSSMAYTVADGVTWMIPPSGSTPYDFPCNADTELCYAWGPSNQYHSVSTTASSMIIRRYRVTKINPAALPAGVDYVPIKVDYRLGIHVMGLAERTTGTTDGLMGTVSAQFGYYKPNTGATAYSFVSVGEQCSNGAVLRCTALPGSTYSDATGNPQTGTFVYQAPHAVLERLGLRVYASLAVQLHPDCRDRMIDDQTVCLINPYSSNGHAVADPYVYIDPSWAYASWYKLEMSADETDASWVVPERTPIDTETLTVIGDSDAGTQPATDGGSDDAGADAGPSSTTMHDAGGTATNDGGTNAGGAGKPGTGSMRDAGLGTDGDGDSAVASGGSGSDAGNDAAASGNGNSDSGCSCEVAGRPRAPTAGWLLLVAVVVTWRARRQRSAAHRQPPACSAPPRSAPSR